MREHPVAHWDGLGDDQEEDFEYTNNEDDLGDLEFKEITAFTQLMMTRRRIHLIFVKITKRLIEFIQLMKGKGKDRNSMIKYYRGPKPFRSTQSLTFSSLGS
jgi:hypothetical protein